MFPEYYSTFKKAIKCVICKVFLNLPSIEWNENIHKKIFTAQETVREMISYLNSFCDFFKLLKGLTELKIKLISNNPTDIELSSIIGQWNHQHSRAYKKSADNCFKHLRDAIATVEKREQKELFSYISSIYSKTEDIIVLVQKNLQNISVQLPRKKNKKLMLI